MSVQICSRTASPKTYTNWMENVHDWCISRQLWWGHQIPAWYCADCGHINVSREDPTQCEACGSTQLIRDEDVLDTWFSSSRCGRFQYAGLAGQNAGRFGVLLSDLRAGHRL